MARDKETNLIINGLSIGIPVVVALLLMIRTKWDLGSWTRSIPHVIGLINTFTSLCLIIGIIAQRTKRIRLHQKMMTTAFCLGGVFLVCYVTYHMTNPSTKYGGEGVLRYIYYFVLLTHIILSLAVLPLVLRAFAWAVTGQIEKHRRVAKWAFPIWLYVSVTGVIAYLMISPYYQ
jgi:putative membrane protein